MRRAVLAALGLTLFLFSFAGANPGGAVSDETDQYIKAIAAGHLDLLGSRVTDQQARAMDNWLPSINRVLTSYPVYGQLARGFSIPSSLDPRYLGRTVEYRLAACLDRRPPAATGFNRDIHQLARHAPAVHLHPSRVDDAFRK